MNTTLRHGLMGFAVLLAWACTSDAVLLPPNYNASQVTHVTVKAGVTTGAIVDALAGLQGGPASTVSGDSDLSPRYVDVGVDVVRMPGGYLCDYALSAVFPDASQSADNPDAYNWTALDTLYNATSGSEGFSPSAVVYQAFYDIGGDCDVDEQGVHRGQRPADIEQWSQVVVNTMRHLNVDLLLSTKADHVPWMEKGIDGKVRYVEFISQPIKLGGYTSVADVASDFVAFAAAVKSAFPNANDGPRIHVITPTMGIEDVDNIVEHPLVLLMDELVAFSAQDDVDVFSFRYEGDSVEEGREVAVRLRQALDERGMAHMALWASEYMPGGALSELLDEQAVALWSARVGALSNALRIAWQGLLDQAIFVRGDRRNLCVGTSCDALDVAESPLWSGNGSWRPAGIGWIPWQYMKGQEAIDAQVSNEQANAATWVLATKSDEGCTESQSTGCGRVHLLITQPGTGETTQAVSYLIKVDGLEDLAGAKQKVQVDRLSVSVDSKEPSLLDSHIIPLIDGELTLPLDTVSPVSEFLVIKKGEG